MAFMDRQTGFHANDFKSRDGHARVRWDRVGVFLAIIAFWIGAIALLLAI